MNTTVKLTKRTRSGNYYLYVFMTIDSVWLFQLEAITEEPERVSEGPELIVSYSKPVFKLLSRTIVRNGETPKVTAYKTVSYPSVGSFVRKAKRLIEFHG